MMRGEKPDGAYPVREQGPIRPLVTAAEVYPALETAVLEAEHTVWLGYRVFEPWTVLTSAAGQRVAADWIGLLRHKLGQGVQVRLLLSDFDAVGATRLHERCWRCLRALSPLWQEGDFAALPALHMAGAGWLWRFMLWPAGLAKLWETIHQLNKLSPEERQYRLACLPGLWPGMKQRSGGGLRIRAGRTPSLYPATYHQKFAVIDSRFALVGGLDVNPRRFDDIHHQRPTNQTWADIMVATEGEIAVDLARHFAECWAREAPRQLRRAERMNRTAPSGMSLPPMPTEDQAPRLPERRSAESEAEAEASFKAAARSPVMVGDDPDDPRPPPELAGKVDGGGPDGGADVATGSGDADGEGLSADGPLDSTAVREGHEQEPAPAAPPARGGTSQVIRTITGQPRGRGLLRLAPRRVANEIERAHLEQIAAARKLIYVETQFLRARGLVDALVRAGRRNRKLGLIIVVPAAPMEIAFEGRRSFADRFGEYLQAHAVRRLRRAFATRVVLIAPLRPVPHRPNLSGTTERAGAHGAEMIFVHSKVMTVDDDAAIVGSANMNGRSLHWDVELALRLEGGAGPPELRRRLFGHWLPKDAPDEAYGLDTAVSVWREIAIDEAGRPPALRRSFVLPYVVRHARRFGRPMPGVPEDFI